MTLLRKGNIPDRINASSGFRTRSILPIVVFILLALGIGTFGCGPKIVRIPVSQEDLIQARNHLIEGNAAYKKKDFNAALVQYRMARNLNPNSEHINNLIGIVFLKQKYIEKSIEAFQQSIRLNKKYASPVNNIGSAYFANGDLKKAEKYFKKAIKLKEDEATYYLNLGTLYLETNKMEKALRAWQKSLSLDPDVLAKTNPISVSISGDNISLKDRYYFMARIHAFSGDVPKAIESLENALLNGFTDIEKIRSSSDFDPIRKDERFIKFMESTSVWNQPQQPAIP